jgi:hypothetical protein
MDVDFLMVEYDKCVPKGIIDYKHEHATLDLTNVGAKTLCNLGNLAKIPAFIVQYGHSNQDGWWGEVAEDSTPYFVVWPLNEHASRFMVTHNFKQTAKLDEVGFVEFLYELRGRKIPADILNTSLKGIK